MEAYKLFQLSTAYGQSLLSYKTGGAPRPFSASFAVSNRCNIRCSYCNFPLVDKPDLTLAQIETLFGKLKKMGVKRLGLMGGEPLYRKDILDIIALGKGYGFAMSMNTNLLLYEKFKDKLHDIDFFYTSLDGTPEKHIVNRGTQSYEKILSAIRHLVGTGRNITAICVVTDPDTSNADYLLDFAASENIQVHFQIECVDTEYARRTSEQPMNNEAMRNFWQHLLARKQQGAPIGTSAEYLKYLTRWNNYSVSAYFEPTETCGAGRGFLFVDASGYAYPCAFSTAKFEGINLLEHEWNEKFDKVTPCTRCIVGPMLEFNLLFQKPVRSLLNAMEYI